MPILWTFTSITLNIVWLWLFSLLLSQQRLLKCQVESRCCHEVHLNLIRSLVGMSIHSKVSSFVILNPSHNLSSFYDATVIIFMAEAPTFEDSSDIWDLFTVILACSSIDDLRTFITIIFIIKFLFRIFVCASFFRDHHKEYFQSCFYLMWSTKHENIWDTKHKREQNFPSQKKTSERVKKAETRMREKKRRRTIKEWKKKKLLHLFFFVCSDTARLCINNMFMYTSESELYFMLRALQRESLKAF